MLLEQRWQGPGVASGGTSWPAPVTRTPWAPGQWQKLLHQKSAGCYASLQVWFWGATGEDTSCQIPLHFRLLKHDIYGKISLFLCKVLSILTSLYSLTATTTIKMWNILVTLKSFQALLCLFIYLFLN